MRSSVRVLSLYISYILCSSIYADTLDWTTDILPSSPSSGVYVGVMVAPGPHSSEVVATWADAITSAPYYSIYSGGSWFTGSIPLTVTVGTDSVGVYDNVFAATALNSSDLVAVWNDSSNEVPYYSVYNAGTWVTGAIDLGGSNGAWDDVTIGAGPLNGQVMATWKNVGDSNRTPYFSLYDGATWTTGTISFGTSNGVKYNVFVTQGPSSGSMLAAWSDSSTDVPYYSIYSGGIWTTATIPLGASTGAFKEVVVAQGPVSGEIVAVWTDSSNHNAYYSIYRGGSWSTGDAIPMGTSSGVNHNVFVSPGKSSNSLVATWADSGSLTPYYAVYNNGSWEMATAQFPLGSSSGSNMDVSIARELGNTGLVATWPNNVSPYSPYYSYIAGTPTPPTPPTSLLPPTGGEGFKKKNQFPLQIEWYNKLSWKASISSGVVGYNIRRNGTLIAALVTTVSYTDYNRPKNGLDSYSITSVDSSGNESPSVLTIQVR